MPDSFTELLERELRPWLHLSPDQVAKLHEHYELLVGWNRKINLTSVEPGPEMVLRHYCESLFFAAQLPVEPASVVDLGSGAGFPGLPIAVLKRAWKVTLVESNQRKAVFLREAGRGLTNLAVAAMRAEDVTRQFDWIVSRAVDPEQVLSLVPKIASRIGLMLSEDDFVAVKGNSAVAWAEPIRLPWGDRRICVYGESVPRETWLK